MKTKRIISLLASLAMMVTAVTGAMTASASEVANGTCGDGITWTLDSEGKLTISGEGAMASPEVQNQVFTGVQLPFDEVINSQLGDYPEIYTYKKEHKEDIKEVVIEEGVTTIGFCAFYKMPNLENVILPSTIKEFKGVGFDAVAGHDSGAKDVSAYASLAFAECTKLKNLTLTEGMTAIGAIAFYGCTALESVKIPSTILQEDAVNLKSNYGWGPYSFVGCTSLKNITLPEGLTVIGAAAFEDTGVDSVVIPSTMKYWSCANSEITVPPESNNGKDKFNGVYSSAFGNCKNLSSVTFADNFNLYTNAVPSWIPFWGCSSLKRVAIPKSVTKLYWMFAYCDGLEEAYIEEGAQISAYGNRDSCFDHSFDYCENLKKVEMFEGVNTISNNPWCAGCTSLTDVYVHGMNSSISRISDSVTIHCDFGSKIYNSASIKNKKIEIDEDIENALKELNTAVTEAEKYSEEDYTTESYGILQTALENAKKYDENSTGVLPIEWAADDIMTAIEGLRDKSEEPSSSDPSSSDPSDSSNPTDNSSDPSNSSDSGQSQPSNSGPSQPTSAKPATNAPTTAAPNVTPPTATTVIKPAKVKAVKVKAKKKKLNVSWKKVSGATGYEVLSATNNKFTKNKKSVTVKKNKVILKRLKSKKKYFVKVRAYKLANGRKYFGKWSKVVKKKVR